MTTTSDMRREGIEPSTYWVSNHKARAGTAAEVPVLGGPVASLAPESGPKASSKWQRSGNEASRRRVLRAQGCYVITDPYRRRHKFGVSVNACARLADLSQANPDLVLTAWVAPKVVAEYLGVDAVDLEGMIHDRLVRDRVWGEWFHVTRDSKAAVAFLEEIEACAVRALAQDEGEWDGAEGVDWWLEADIAGDRFMDWLRAA